MEDRQHTERPAPPRPDGDEARGVGRAVGLAPPCLLPALPLVICEVSLHLWSDSVQALAGDQG